jgi:hypothetical protein
MVCCLILSARFFEEKRRATEEVVLRTLEASLKCVCVGLVVGSWRWGIRLGWILGFWKNFMP